MTDSISRRELLRTAALGSIGLGLAGSAHGLAPSESETVLERLIVGPPQKAKSMIGVPFERRETVRLGFIGTGLRGRSLLGEFVNVPGVRVVAVCDVVREKAEKAKEIVEKAGQTAPAIYVDGDHGYQALLKRDDIDLVVIAEGIETKEQAQLLARFGCQQGQGFHFGRPRTEWHVLGLTAAA